MYVLILTELIKFVCKDIVGMQYQDILVLATLDKTLRSRRGWSTGAGPGGGEVQGLARALGDLMATRMDAEPRAGRTTASGLLYFLRLLFVFGLALHNSIVR